MTPLSKLRYSKVHPPPSTPVLHHFFKSCRVPENFALKPFAHDIHQNRGPKTTLDEHQGIVHAVNVDNADGSQFSNFADAHHLHLSPRLSD
eukprot:1183995-Prorocentrum_minimum.AAC.4